jgi:hypothetical protein
VTAVSRYSRAPLLAMGAFFGTSRAASVVRSAVRSGALQTQETVLRGADRLDTMAGALYGDARYWWILAAASDVGWGLQVPPGTVIRAPALGDVLALVG